jgi:hypothetical protein
MNTGVLPKLDVAGSSPVARSVKIVDQQAFTEIGAINWSPIFCFQRSPNGPQDENLGTVAEPPVYRGEGQVKSQASA